MPPARKISRIVRNQGRAMVRDAKDTKVYHLKRNQKATMGDHRIGNIYLLPDEELAKMGGKRIPGGVSFLNPKRKNVQLDIREKLQVKSAQLFSDSVQQARLMILLQNPVFVKKYRRTIDLALNRIPEFQTFPAAGPTMRPVIEQMLHVKPIPTHQIQPFIQSPVFKEWLARYIPKKAGAEAETIDPQTVKEMTQQLGKILANWKNVPLTPLQRKLWNQWNKLQTKSLKMDD